MAIGLGIDAGGSATRWLLLNDNQELAKGQVESITGHIFTPEDRERNFSRLEQLFQDVLKHTRPDAVVGGFTGLYPDTEATREFNRFAAQKLGLELANVHLTNDMHIAYACAFEPGQGVLVYAGTGSVGYFEDVNGKIISSGGYGYLLDDFGAAFWVGQQAIQQVMRWFDEQGQPSSELLAEEVYAVIGSDIWDNIMRFTYGDNPRGILAKLSPAVTKAAEQNDPTAIHILQHAGTELARLANVILKRLGQQPPRQNPPVGFMGGMSQASPILSEAFQKALPKDTTVVKVTVEPVLAAARLALKRLTI
jgi:glucosamine kinase